MIEELIKVIRGQPERILEKEIIEIKADLLLFTKKYLEKKQKPINSLIDFIYYEILDNESLKNKNYFVELLQICVDLAEGSMLDNVRMLALDERIKQIRQDRLIK